MTFATLDELCKSRSSHDAGQIFSDGEQLWTVCCEYFDWVSNNPVFIYKKLSRGGDTIYVPLERPRAMSIGDLCLFLNISRATWRNYRIRQELRDVVEWAEANIRDHNFCAAAVGLLKANVVSRQLFPGDFVDGRAKA